MQARLLLKGPASMKHYHIYFKINYCNDSLTRFIDIKTNQIAESSALYNLADSKHTRCRLSSHSYPGPLGFAQKN